MMCFQSKTLVTPGKAKCVSTLSTCSPCSQVKLVLCRERADTFRRLPLPRIQPVPHSCSSLQCVPLFVTFLTCIVSGGSTGWPIPTQEGAGGQAECHRINVTQMALTWTDPVTSIGFPQPQRAGRLVSYLLHSTLLCTDRVSVICLFLAPGQAAGDTVTINSVTRWAAVRTV